MKNLTNKLLMVIIGLIIIAMYYVYNKSHEEKLYRDYVHNKEMCNYYAQKKEGMFFYPEDSVNNDRLLDSFTILVLTYENSHK